MIAGNAEQFSAIGWQFVFPIELRQIGIC